MQILTKFSLVVLLAVPGLALGADCSCDAYVEMSVGCRLADWPSFSDRKVESYADLGVLLEDLIEGTQSAAVCYSSSQVIRDLGCNVELMLRDLKEEVPLDDPGFDELMDAWDCAEACSSECLDTALLRYNDLIRKTESAAIRWGAIALSYGTFMDTGASKEWTQRYTETSVHVLNEVHDTVSIAAMLKMMEFYDLSEPAVIDAIAQHMTHESRLVRILSYNLFYKYTTCPLMDDWSQDQEPTREEVDAARAWWVKKRDT